jgi:glycosyltransferase involved in cell wall biosynthesis
LRFGAGVKGKVIEALALGVPCATTSTGAQGIVSDRPCLFVGDEPDELAAVVVQALTDRQVAAERVGHGLDFIEQRYGRKNLVELFRRLI